MPDIACLGDDIVYTCACGRARHIPKGLPAIGGCFNGDNPDFSESIDGIPRVRVVLDELGLWEKFCNWLQNGRSYKDCFNILTDSRFITKAISFLREGK